MPKDISCPFGILLLTKYTVASGPATIGSPEARRVIIDDTHWTLYNESDYVLGQISSDSIIGYLKMLSRPLDPQASIKDDP